jgi:assimilatory nitrate reductase catalytic subunit
VVASPRAGSVQKKVGSLELLVVCDSFINETAELAHVVLPITQWAEEEGTTTNLEGRVLLRRRAMEPPAGVRSDIAIMCELAKRMGHEQRFDYESTEAVFDELRRATAGGRADYSGMTYERLTEQQGIFWPCPSEGHEGTPRLFSERFAFPDGKARFSVVPYRNASELPSPEYPLFFTTGRYKEHYNSGAQTRRVSKLVEAKSEPRLQIHPRLAERMGIVEDSQVLVESRRGRVVFRASVSIDIRPDTLFAPFHWGGRLAANLLTNPALDPTSRMPEFKVCAVRARRIDASSELVELFSNPSPTEIDGHATP